MQVYVAHLSNEQGTKASKQLSSTLHWNKVCAAQNKRTSTALSCMLNASFSAATCSAAVPLSRASLEALLASCSRTSFSSYGYHTQGKSVF